MGDNFLYKAKLAEQTERYEDMVDFMKKEIKHRTVDKATLTDEHRNLLSVAYKNVIGGKRTAWRVVNSLEQAGKFVNKDIIEDYKGTIKTELIDITHEVLDLIKDILSNSSSDDTESRVFFLKMKGDYNRYKAEVLVDDDRSRDEVIKEAESSYIEAETSCIGGESSIGLPSTNPLRLGLALNQSVFYFEIMSNPTKACEIAKKAFDDAIAELDQLSEDSYKDSTLIMQLLRDNLTLWTSDAGDNEEDK